MTSYKDIIQLGSDETHYRKLDIEPPQHEVFHNRDILHVTPDQLTALTCEAFHDINHYLRPSHLQQLRNILDDDEASPNDHYVAYDLLKNATISADGVFPMCQDTGTAIIMAKKGRYIWTDFDEKTAIAQGVLQCYENNNLRYSQVAPLSMFDEVNTKNNLPAQIDIYNEGTDSYKFLFVAKGGGSANKSFFFQPTPSMLEETRLLQFIEEKIVTLGTAACPPYHLAIVIGGTSAEFNMKTLKLASCHYLDSIPQDGDETGRAFRDIALEQRVLTMSQQLGIGAQFGGKYFCHDVRVIRLPRHGASLPISIGVSCSADRQALGKITRDGVFLEQLETNPVEYIPAVDSSTLSGTMVHVNLDQPMADILTQLRSCPIKTRLSLSGTMIVARDSAHRRIREAIAQGASMPDYFKNHPVYYAGPAKTPEGYPSGSFGPTTAGRMDGFVEEFQALGGSMIMLAKGNRSHLVKRACKKYGGVYLGSIGGSGARLGHDYITNVEVLDFEDLGMEAIWRITVKNMPAFVIIDSQGNDFFDDVIS